MKDFAYIMGSFFFFDTKYEYLETINVMLLVWLMFFTFIGILIFFSPFYEVTITFKQLYFWLFFIWFHLRIAVFLTEDSPNDITNES